jgi:hypothetical protein
MKRSRAARLHAVLLGHKLGQEAAVVKNFGKIK